MRSNVIHFLLKLTSTYDSLFNCMHIVQINMGNIAINSPVWLLFNNEWVKHNPLHCLSLALVVVCLFFSCILCFWNKHNVSALFNSGRHYNFFWWEYAVFSMSKSLRVLQKARVKIVARAIYTYLFFSYTYILLFCWKIKSCCDSLAN